MVPALKRETIDRKIMRPINHFLSKMMVPVLRITPHTTLKLTSENAHLRNATKEGLTPPAAKAIFLEHHVPDKAQALSHRIKGNAFVLDVMQLIPATAPPEKETKHLVFFLGNFSAYEYALEELLKIAQKYHCHVWVFNYRGASQSEGMAEGMRDFIEDGETLIQFLLDKNISPEKIVLRGHSMGGAIAIAVASAFLKKKIYVNVFISRTFSSIEKVVLGELRLKCEYPRGPERGKRQIQFKRLGKWLSVLSQPLVSGYLAYTGARMNFSDLYLRLPAGRKECLGVFAPTPLQATLDIPADFKIHSSASFEKGIESATQLARNLLIESIAIIKQLKNADKHDEKLVIDQLTLLRTKMQMARANVSAIVCKKLLSIESRVNELKADYEAHSSFKKIEADLTTLSEGLSEICDRFLFAYKMALAPTALPESNAHSIPLSQLHAICHQGLSGEDHFEAFFNLVS